MDRLIVLTWRVPRANADVLEAATLPEKDAAHILAELRQAAGADEIVYVPTCQRVLLALHGAAEDAPTRLVEAYAKTLGRQVPEPEAFAGYEGFRHLCEVSASLDSLVLGEPQVLGQFKAAAQRCDEAALSSSALRHAFSLVFRTAKAVRSQTELFRGKVSLVPLTETLVETALKDVARPKVAVLGTGQIGEKTIELLRRFPDVEVHVVSRNLERAHEVAAAIDGVAHRLESFLEEIPDDLDCLALAMRTESPLVSAKTLEALAAKRPLLVLDLALPRNAERPASDVPGLRLVQMDDLSRMSEASRERRAAEYESARAVMERELARVRAEYAQRRLAHDLAHLAQRFDDVARERLVRAAGEAGLAVDDAALGKWYEQTVRALLHEATAAVKKAGCRDAGEPR